MKYPFLVALMMSITVVACKTKQPTTQESTPKVATDLALGKTVFEANCKKCHGKTDEKLVHFAKEAQHQSPEETIKIIMFGKSPMPRFADVLTEKEIYSVNAYVHSLK